MKNQNYAPTWNRAYPSEDLHEYTKYHVIVKVADTKFRLFPRTSDAFYYWKKLRANLSRYGCQLVEYMTMRTHCHFLALTPDGLYPLMKAVLATNISYGMHLRYAAKRSKPSEKDLGLIDLLCKNPKQKIFQKHNCYIPIVGYRHLLIELRYINRNPENANIPNGDRFISSRQEYNRNYFEFIDKEAVTTISRLFSMEPHMLHRELMVDDEVWRQRIDDLMPNDISDEQQVFKVPHARYPLFTFSFPDISVMEDNENDFWLM